ncbi:MAG TPA: hypothetical protein VJ983_09350 [candidate division Zixibacteria bacterium]|nr:hypothetical protein [candidate division Zixibacteria bacterium]
MNNETARTSASAAILVTSVLFVVARLLGLLLPSSGWAFDQWAYLPWWYLVLWAVGGAGITFLLVRQSNLLEKVFDSPRMRIVGILFLAALLFAFRFNSFLYGGGNYQIAKLAQTESILHRWYEFGSLWIADIFYQAISLLSFTANTSAYIAWKAFGFIGTLLTFVAAVKISREMSKSNGSRLAAFAILFFGPQTLLYFNFIGFEPMLIAVIYWFIYFALRVQEGNHASSIIPLWITASIGLLLHVSMLMLIPAALFLTLRVLFKNKATVPTVLGLAALAALAVAAYSKAYGSREYGQYLLFLHDRNLQSDYNLLTGTHLIDFAKLLAMTFPQTLIVLVLLLVRDYKSGVKSSVGTLALLSISGAVVVLLVEPSRGMALDAPIMAAFLAPLAPLLALLVHEQFAQHTISKQAVGVVAGLALLVPLSIMPVYSRIGYADGYIRSFLDRHPFYWYEGGTAMRDAYFYKEDNPEKPNANRWDQAIPVESQDYLDLTAAKEYILAKQYSNALEKLFKLKTKYRYWVEPRLLIAAVQSNQGRYDLAKPEIDTCLMINPYDKASLISRYRYYLNINDIPGAITEVKKAIAVYPHDNEMKADLAIYWYRAHDFKTADSLAASLIQTDSTLAYPHLIRGFIAELKNEPRRAIRFYQDFINLAPDAQEVPQIRKKLNSLILEEQKKTR